MVNNKIVVIAGEDSGDLHGSKLIAQMKSVDPNLSFYVLLLKKHIIYVQKRGPMLNRNNIRISKIK